MEHAYNFAIARRENTDSVIPALVEGQAPQIIFSIKLVGEDATDGPARKGKKSRGPKREKDGKKLAEKAFIRQGREAFNRLLKQQGIPVPDITEQEHKQVDKMDLTNDFNIIDEPQQETTKGGKPKRARVNRRLGWHAMLKQLMLFGNDGTGNFNAEEFAAKMHEFGAQIQ